MTNKRTEPYLCVDNERRQLPPDLCILRDHLERGFLWYRGEIEALAGRVSRMSWLLLAVSVALIGNLLMWAMCLMH